MDKMNIAVLLRHCLYGCVNIVSMRIHKCEKVSHVYPVLSTISHAMINKLGLEQDLLVFILTPFGRLYLSASTADLAFSVG